MQDIDTSAGDGVAGSPAVLGVRFQEAAKIYYFEPGGFDGLDAGSYVVVETSRGIELGRVVIAPGQVLSAELTEPLKPIIRPGTPEDLEQSDRLKMQAADATLIARERARALDLPMKIVASQYTLDGTRLTISFTSEGRVDFRDLVRDLAQHIRAQVQLRQVGPRDQAKLIGGYGRCGRRLCCTSWLTAFPSISIKMAKEQNLPLNPSKISGQCGRLLCCLSYENDVYKQLKAELPRPDSWVSTPTGNARVVAVNAIRQLVTLQFDDLRMVEMTAAQLGIDRGVVRPLGGVPQADVEATGPDGEELIVESVVSVGIMIEETVIRRVAPQRPPQGEGRPRQNSGQPPRGNNRPAQPLPPGRGDGRPQGRGGTPPERGGSVARNAGQPRQDLPQQPPAALDPAAASPPSGEARPRRRRRHRGSGKTE